MLAAADKGSGTAASPETRVASTGNNLLAASTEVTAASGPKSNTGNTGNALLDLSSGGNQSAAPRSDRGAVVGFGLGVFDELKNTVVGLHGLGTGPKISTDDAILAHAQGKSVKSGFLVNLTNNAAGVATFAGGLGVDVVGLGDGSRTKVIKDAVADAGQTLSTGTTEEKGHLVGRATTFAALLFVGGSGSKAGYTGMADNMSMASRSVRVTGLLDDAAVRSGGLLDDAAARTGSLLDNAGSLLDETATATKFAPKPLGALETRIGGLTPAYSTSGGVTSNFAGLTERVAGNSGSHTGSLIPTMRGTAGEIGSTTIKPLSTNAARTQAGKLFTASGHAMTQGVDNLAGSLDDLLKAGGQSSDNITATVSTITENARILSKPGATTRELSEAALKIERATVGLVEHSGGPLGQNISRVTDDVSRLLTSASDNVVTRKLSGLTDEIGAARTLPGLSDNVATSLDDLERSVNSFSTASNRQTALAGIEQSIQKIAAENPELARALSRSIEGLDDAVKLGGRMTDNTTGLSGRVVESALPRSLDDVPKFLDQSVRQVKVHANQVGQGADDLLKKVNGVDDTSRLMRQELESISRNSRALADESTSAARAAQASREIELSVRRLSEVAGPRFQDDIARLAQDSRALTTASRNTSLATDLLAGTIDNTATFTAQTAEHSSNVSQNILRLQERAAETLPRKTATAFNNNLDDLATASRRIAEGSVDDLTVRQARRALENLEKLGTGFGDDLTRLADDTNKLIVSAQRQTAATAVGTATQSLTRQGGNLTRQIDDLVTTAERANLPSGLLDDISTNAGRLGRSTDDMALVRQIDDGLKLMEGKVDSRTINSIRTTLAEVEQSAINLERARRLEQATQRLFEQADTVRNAVTRFVESGNPSPVVRETLVRAADDLATRPQSTAVTRFQQLVKVIDDPELTQALKPALKSLDDTIAETNTLSRFSTQGARAQEALTRIAEGTSSDVTRSFINGIKQDLAEFGTTTQSGEILKRVYNQVDALPGQVGRDVRAIVDETVDIARLEQTAAATALAGRQVGTVTSGLVPVSAEEAVALSRIETIASQIGSGASNAGLITSLERSLASLSPQNQAALEGLIATLKANLTEQSGLVQNVITQQELMIGRNMPRVTRLADLANRSGDLTEVGQRLDVARFLQGGETASLQQTRIAHTVADFAANTADPVMMQLRDGALQKLVRQGDPAAYQQLLIDGLTSEGWKVRTLAAGGSTSRLGAGASNFYQAGKYLLTFQDPKLSRTFLWNTAVFGLSAGGTATYLGFKTQDLLDRYAEPGTEADRLRERMRPASGNDAESRDNEVPSDGFLNRHGAMIDSPDAYRMEKDLQGTGKLRSFSQIGYVAPDAPAPVQRLPMARTVRFTPMSPDARQGDLVKLAIQQFSMRRIRDFNVQSQLLNATEERVRANKITGFGSAGTGSAQLSTSLRSVAVAQGMKLSSSIHDLMGRENTEAQGLDRTRVTSGGGPGQTSIAAYSSPSGLTFAKVDPDQGSNAPGSEQDDEKEITEALLSAANSEGGTEAVV